MVWIWYLICTLFAVVILFGLSVLLKQDVIWLNYLNVFNKNTRRLDKRVLADLVRKMFLFIILTLSITTLIIYLLNVFTNISFILFFFIYALAYIIPIVNYHNNIKKLLEI